MRKIVSSCLLALVLVVCILSCAECQEYEVESVNVTPNGYSVALLLQDGTAGPFGGDVRKLDMNVFMETEDRIRIRIRDSEKKRWEVPNIVKSITPEKRPQNTNYDVKLDNLNFGFEISRSASTDILFSTTKRPFVFEDQYISIGTRLPQNAKIYGLGERVREFKLATNANYTLFNKDTPSTYGENLYGSHPFYLDYRDGKAHGVFLLNSNGMDVELLHDSLQFKVIGGIIDLYIFTGPTPEKVFQQYHEVIGKPFLPPMWAFGWHQCRWGYSTLQQTKLVVQRYKENMIPLEAIWNDIDYMDNKKAFTWDSEGFPLAQVKDFVSELHGNNQHYIVILDPGILSQPGYKPYDNAIQMNITVKKNDGITPIHNKVWPGVCIFPDFTNPATQEYWTSLITEFMKDVPVDALWLDMNEVATFCKGECDSSSIIAPRTTQTAEFNPNSPPYVPGGVDLADKTLWMDSVQTASIYYNTHNLYGITSSNMTRTALTTVRPNERALVITRSTFPGSGHYVAHWTGDNFATWEYLHWSISGVINMNMFGIPFVGADICGFFGNTTEELCARWMQLGSFYPFARNHADIKANNHEPYQFGLRLVNISRNVLQNRYSLLPYYYTQFANVHRQGGTVFKALMFEFPHVPSLADIDRQFMIGPSLMVSPVLEQGATQVSAMFPPGLWYDYFTGVLVSNQSTIMTLDAPLEVIPVHMRGGRILVRQDPKMTIAETRQTSFELVVALDETGGAVGDLYWDDGVSVNSVRNRNFSEVRFFARFDGSSGMVNSSIVANGFTRSTNDQFVDKLVVYGITVPICSASLDGKALTIVDYHTARQKLYLVGLHAPANSPFIVTFEACNTKKDNTALYLVSAALTAIILVLGIFLVVFISTVRAKNKRQSYDVLQE